MPRKLASTYFEGVYGDFQKYPEGMPTRQKANTSQRRDFLNWFCGYFLCSRCKISIDKLHNQQDTHWVLDMKEKNI